MNDEILSEAEEISTNLRVEDEVDSTENVETNDLTEITQLVKSLAELDNSILEAEGSKQPLNKSASI